MDGTHKGRLALRLLGRRADASKETASGRRRGDAVLGLLERLAVRPGQGRLPHRLTSPKRTQHTSLAGCVDASEYPGRWSDRGGAAHWRRWGRSSGGYTRKIARPNVARHSATDADCRARSEELQSVGKKEQEKRGSGTGGECGAGRSSVRTLAYLSPATTSGTHC
jgi:hypothetical protein